MLSLLKSVDPCLAAGVVFVLFGGGCAGALSGVSDGIDIVRGTLPAVCTVETVPCEVARAALNDAIVTYNFAVSHPDDVAAVQAAQDSIAAVSALVDHLSHAGAQ